jgi:succinate dehydrogenase / fumarate reductase cytochrome b subunit
VSQENAERKGAARSITPWIDVWKRGVGQWAFLLHRLTGVALFAYLILHVETVSSLLGGPQHYAATLEAMNSLSWHVVIALIFAVGIFHGANGIRIVLTQFDSGGRHQKSIFWVLLLAGIATWVYVAYTIFALGIAT